MTDEHYTPTDEDMRDAYRHGRDPLAFVPSRQNGADAREEFDRWLAAHDARIAGEALERAGSQLARIKRGDGLEIVDDTWLVLRTDGSGDTLYGVGEFPDTDAEPLVNLTEVQGWTAPRDGL